MRTAPVLVVAVLAAACAACGGAAFGEAASGGEGGPTSAEHESDPGVDAGGDPDAPAGSQEAAALEGGPGAEASSPEGSAVPEASPPDAAPEAASCGLGGYWCAGIGSCVESTTAWAYCGGYDGGTGPVSCETPAAVSGGFQALTGDESGYSGCLVTAQTPVVGFGPVGTDVPACSGDVYPCCVGPTSKDWTGSCACYTCFTP